jgi:hypothetical protein
MPLPNGPRDPIAGPDVVQSPFPLKLRGPVIKGFGRGSKEVCIHSLQTYTLPFVSDISSEQSFDTLIFFLNFLYLTSHLLVARHTNSQHPPQWSLNSRSRRSRFRCLLRLGFFRSLHHTPKHLIQFSAISYRGYKCTRTIPKFRSSGSGERECTSVKAPDTKSEGGDQGVPYGPINRYKTYYLPLLPS